MNCVSKNYSLGYDRYHFSHADSMKEKKVGKIGILAALFTISTDRQSE